MPIRFTESDLYQLPEIGIHFPNAVRWVDRENPMRMLTDSAALITQPNVGVPAEFTSFLDPEAIEIVTAPRNAREIFEESKKGDWTTTSAKWRIDEITGKVEPYTDRAQNGESDINTNWLVREQFRFQTLIHYGDLEQAMNSLARINLAASRQQAAATILDIAANYYYLFGVENLNIFGILNDPNLPNSVSPIVETIGGTPVTQWNDGKTTVMIYNDILSLYAELVTNANGLIDNNTELVLVTSPAKAVQLGKATDFNVSVLDMLNRYFRNLRLVTLPELATGSGGEEILLIAPRVAGGNTGLLGYSEKFKAGRIIPLHSSYEQKFTCTTYGGIILRPYGIARMVGV